MPPFVDLNSVAREVEALDRISVAHATSESEG
jgi:hypothetical protein